MLNRTSQLIDFPIGEEYSKIYNTFIHTRAPEEYSFTAIGRFFACRSFTCLIITSLFQDLTSNQSQRTESSVFSNPFRDKEERDKAILERHVEMTSKQVNKERFLLVFNCVIPGLLLPFKAYLHVRFQAAITH